MKDLKPVYQAETLELAELRLEELDEKWVRNMKKCWNPGEETGPNLLVILDMSC